MKSPKTTGKQRRKKALAYAVAAIYFNDSSDYGLALWEIVDTLDEEACTLLAKDEATAFERYAEGVV